MSVETLFALPKSIRHPARYTDVLMLTFVDMLRGSKRILDPFGGTGKVFLLNAWLPDVEIQAVEIEPEWAALHPRTTLGNALALPWPGGYFDAICTSPAYGNRMADPVTHSKNGFEWRYYAYSIGRKLHADNGASMQWGDDYRDLHRRAWIEARRVLQPGGLFVLNIKDHIRDMKHQHVTDWHITTLVEQGFDLVKHVKIPVPSYKFGRNGEKRVPYESVILFRREGLL